MKKKIASMLAAVAAVSMLAGCSNKFSQVLVGEWASKEGVYSMAFKSNGTYTTGSIEGTWSISNDGVLTGQYDWGGSNQVSIANIEIVDNNTIRMYDDTYSTYLYRVGEASSQDDDVSQTNSSENNTTASDKNSFDKLVEDGTITVQLGSMITDCSETLSGELVIPNSINQISPCAFQLCSRLKKVVLPTGLGTIANFVFTSCTELESVIIPDTVTSIQEGAFYGCTNLKEITIPNSVAYIGNLVFDGCINVSVTYNGKTYTYDNIEELYTAING